MKTREQVLKHLMEVGYTKGAIGKIMGFLIGKDLKAIDEQITYKKGEESFEYFMNWFNSEEKKVKKTKREAYEEIAGFLTNNERYVPAYWLEYLNEDIKIVKLQNEELNNKAKKALDNFEDPLSVLKIWFGQ